MKKRFSHVAGALLLATAVFAQPAFASKLAQGNDFVKQTGPELRLNGKIFRFAGTNNYYLMYKSPAMVDDVLSTAAANGFNVVRMWGSLEIGNQDGSNSIHGKSDGVYFHYWNGTEPAYNDGLDGLQRLDYVIWKAGQLGIRLVIPFVNNWNAFGGMDQYVRWRGGNYHDDFYTDPIIRQWFKNWITHLLNRVNPLTGLAYKDDPTIMMWELANEPRCLSAGAYPRSPNCTTQTLVNWAAEMSAHVKSIDDKHLVSVGDEGFYCIPGATDWTENCGEGVDTLAFARLPTIDAMSFHLYPDHWGKDAAWGTQWIERHFADARALRKPALLGEYGYQDKATRNVVFKQWTDAVFKSGGTGALYWILSGKQDDGSLYADYDGFTVYCPSPVCTTISNFGQMMRANKVMTFVPVADNDSAVVEFNTPAILNPAANDIAYGGATVLSSSIDLEPTSTGQQTTKAVAGGTFAWQTDGTVVFTPASGFVGTATAQYTIQDSAGRTSNTASLSVTVKPDPTAAIKLFSFESGTEGWASANWQSDAGTVAQSADYATDGISSLKVTTTGGGWFGVAPGSIANLTGKSRLKIDLKTTNAGTSTNVALQFGDGWTWCEGSWGYVNAGTTSTLDIDLYALNCASPDLSKLNGIYVWFSGGGTFYMDNVRAE